jgi:hypothetical protein
MCRVLMLLALFALATGANAVAADNTVIAPATRVR